MYTILVPVDADEDRARGQAAFVSELPAADTDIEAVITHALTGEEVDAPEEIRNVERIATVRLVRDYLEERDVDVRLAEGQQPPADGILSLAEEFDANHIAMGSRKRSPTGKAVFGSVSQQVLLEADVPVTVVGAREE
ncbi:universal stress protein [Haloarcula salina]|uniref:universal stress protein n=1 Tax=Haloarcula salina TaxID=1429914 RepID=UPI003C6FE715